MNIFHDEHAVHTVQHLNERLQRRVGQVARTPSDDYYLVLDNGGQYGYADLVTGQALFPTTTEWLQTADREWAWFTDLRLLTPTLKDDTYDW